MDWSLQKVEWHCGQAEICKEETDKISHKISTFLESCPSDIIEELNRGNFGRVYRLFLERCCQRAPEDENCLSKRDELATKLKLCGFTTDEGQKLLYALMPFFPRGGMRVDGAKEKLPTWLYDIYSKRYEESIEIKSENTNISEEPSLKNRIFLNKVLGLSNLYYIDPDDSEIKNELRAIRMQLIELMLKTSANEFSECFTGELGDRYWAMAQSGIQTTDMGNEEIAKRNEIQEWLTTTPNSLRAEGGIQRFASALLFSKPGTVKIANPEQNLPKWFVEGFKRFNSMAAQ